MSAPFLRETPLPSQVFLTKELLCRLATRALKSANAEADTTELAAQNMAICGTGKWGCTTDLFDATRRALDGFGDPTAPLPPHRRALRNAAELLSTRVPRRINNDTPHTQLMDFLRTAALLEALTRGHGLHDVELLDSMRPGFAALAIELGDLQAFQDLRLRARHERFAHVVTTARDLLSSIDGLPSIRDGQQIIDYLRAVEAAPVLAPAVAKPKNNARPLAKALALVAELLASKKGPTATAGAAGRTDETLRDAGQEQAAELMGAASERQLSNELELATVAGMRVLADLLEGVPYTVTSDGGSMDVAGRTTHFHTFRALALVSPGSAPDRKDSAWARRAAAAKKKSASRRPPADFVPTRKPKGPVNSKNLYMRDKMAAAMTACSNDLGAATALVNSEWDALDDAAKSPWTDEATAENLARQIAKDRQVRRPSSSAFERRGDGEGVGHGLQLIRHRHDSLSTARFPHRSQRGERRVEDVPGRAAVCAAQDASSLPADSPAN